MIRRPPRSTHCISSAASDVYKRQVWNTHTKVIPYTVRRPVYETKQRTINYTVNVPSYETRSRTINYTVMKPVTETRTRTVTSYVREAVPYTKTVTVNGGHWENRSYTVPGKSISRQVQGPGTWTWDPSTCRNVYQPGCCQTVCCETPARTCCKKVWVPTCEQKQVTCTRYVLSLIHI